MRTARIFYPATTVGCLVGLFLGAFPMSARAAWVNPAKTQFEVGGQLAQISNAAWACPTQGTADGGTSLALVQGFRVPEVDVVANSLLLVVSCRDTNTANAARLNFISPSNGAVIQQIYTSIVPSGGYPHMVLRPDKGDLLGCAANGALYSINFSSATGSPLTAPTAQSSPPFPADATPSCTGLAWDAEADVIYMGLSVNGSNKVGRIVRFKEVSWGSWTLQGDFTSLPCTASGLAISGGALLMSCVPTSQGPTMLRLDKNTGLQFLVFGAWPSPSSTVGPPSGLGDLACDPVTFSKDMNGKDLFTDALWSRQGAGGNTVVALEFPAFTCGLPTKSVFAQNSPLAAGFSIPGTNGPGERPLVGCFDDSGTVKDQDDDGIPDCWETNGIDFDGDLVPDYQLCVQVDTNGDGLADTTECANPNHKDLFVEIDYMQYHKPDPQALAQVRGAFAAAPSGINVWFQVDEQVTFTPEAAGSAPTSHVNQVALTPCTGPAKNALDTTQSVDFDVVKASNFGTATDRANPKRLIAKRLVSRYILFAHNVVGDPGGGSGSSGCSEVGGDDAVVSLGSFLSTTVNGVPHNRGNTDQQAGTLMHELGHTLGLRHGGDDGINCKPNYRSVMSYTRQFAGSPMPNRPLDYSRGRDDTLDEMALNECNGIGITGPQNTDPGDYTVFGPGSWSLVPLPLNPGLVTTDCPLLNPIPINWDRSRAKGGKQETYQSSTMQVDLNVGPTAGCSSPEPGAAIVLRGHDDWSNLLYRASAALDFAGGARSETPSPDLSSGDQEMNDDDENAFSIAVDRDHNGIGDGEDCGAFLCPCHAFLCPHIPFTRGEHRIDIKPTVAVPLDADTMQPLPKPLTFGTSATATIVIFSEVNPDDPQEVWSASQIITDSSCANTSPVPLCLTFSVGSVTEPVKTNSNGQGTCSMFNAEDPITHQDDKIKDAKCQFETAGLPLGTYYGTVSGGFFVDPKNCADVTDPQCVRAFSARQAVNILP